MAGRERVICESRALIDGAAGMRFALRRLEGGFAVRFHGVVHAYVNRCPHLGTELDWDPGRFFEETGLYLICSTHGALFEPETGLCVAGPCRGACLERLQTRERNGQVLLLNDAPPPAEPDAMP